MKSGGYFLAFLLFVLFSFLTRPLQAADEKDEALVINQVTDSVIPANEQVGAEALAMMSEHDPQQEIAKPDEEVQVQKQYE